MIGPVVQELRSVGLHLLPDHVLGYLIEDAARLQDQPDVAPGPSSPLNHAGGVLRIILKDDMRRPGGEEDAERHVDT